MNIFDIYPGLFRCDPKKPIIMEGNKATDIDKCKRLPFRTFPKCSPYVRRSGESSFSFLSLTKRLLLLSPFSKGGR